MESSRLTFLLEQNTVLAQQLTSLSGIKLENYQGEYLLYRGILYSLDVKTYLGCKRYSVNTTPICHTSTVECVICDDTDSQITSILRALKVNADTIAEYFKLVNNVQQLAISDDLMLVGIPSEMLVEGVTAQDLVKYVQVKGSTETTWSVVSLLMLLRKQNQSHPDIQLIASIVNETAVLYEKQNLKTPVYSVIGDYVTEVNLETAHEMRICEFLATLRKQEPNDEICGAYTDEGKNGEEEQAARELDTLQAIGNAFDYVSEGHYAFVFKSDSGTHGLVECGSKLEQAVKTYNTWVNSGYTVIQTNW